MQPSPIADTRGPQEPRRRKGIVRVEPPPSLRLSPRQERGGTALAARDQPFTLAGGSNEGAGRRSTARLARRAGSGGAKRCFAKPRLRPLFPSSCPFRPSAGKGRG